MIVVYFFYNESLITTLLMTNFRIKMFFKARPYPNDCQVGNINKADVL